MKRRRASVVIVCLAFLLIFLIHQITLLSFSRSSSPANSTNIIQEKRSQFQTSHWKVMFPNQPSHELFTPPPPPRVPPPRLINCDRTHERYDICTLNGPTTMDPSISTFYMWDDHPISTTNSLGSPPKKHKIRPYPRKWENSTMSRIKELTLITSPAKVHCQVQHKAPALVFSVGGYTGNLFHDFNDGFIPFFVSVRSIFSPIGVQPVFVVSNSHDWWLQKYSNLLQQFTPYPIINLDDDTTTHCFPSTTVGLISHGYMTIDSKMLPNTDTFLDFRVLIGNAYDAKTVRQSSSSLSTLAQRPILVLVGRKGDVGRVIMNQAEVVLLAKEVGFEVSIFEPTKFTSLSKAYELINKSHAMVGVHGAALTHSLFLRPGSVFIQVVPIGIDWLAETCFGKSAREMGLEYMEYKIKVNESSLVEKYGMDHLVLKNPNAVMKEKWSNTKNIYLKNQNVKVDLVRFGRYLRKAYKKAKGFMGKEG